MKCQSALLLLSLVVAPAFTTAATTPQTAEAAIEKHIAAMGGREALAKLTSRKSTGTITISTPGGDISGPVEISSKAPNKSRAYAQLDLSALGMSEQMILDQRFDGTKGWVLNSLQGDQEMPASQQASQKNNVFPTLFLSYKDAGTTVALLPSEKVGTKDAIVLMVTPKSGPALKMFLDPDTYLLVRSSGKVQSPEAGEFEQVSEPSDYRAVDGVKIPFMIVTTSPLQTVTIKLTKVENNVVLDDALFSVK